MPVTHSQHCLDFCHCATTYLVVRVRAYDLVLRKVFERVKVFITPVAVVVLVGVAFVTSHYLLGVEPQVAVFVGALHLPGWDEISWHLGCLPIFDLVSQRILQTAVD